MSPKIEWKNISIHLKIIAILTIITQSIKAQTQFLAQSSIAATCNAGDLRSPLKLKTPWYSSGFNVQLHFTTPQVVQVRRVSQGIFKIEGEFGEFQYMDKRYSVDAIYMKSPGEHTFNGLRYAVEIQTEGTAADNNKATLVSFLEQNNLKHNPNLKKINFGKNYYTRGSAGRGQIVEFQNAEFTLEDFYKFPQEYLMYVGSSTNAKCPDSLILINQNINWISRAQMKDLGELNPIGMHSKFGAGGQKIFQNFIIRNEEDEKKDPLQVTFHKFEDMPPAFPVPFQFARVMYVPPRKKPLGTVPKGCVPYWESIGDSAVVYEPSSKPKIGEGFKMINYCWLPQGRNTYTPQYIVVPDYFEPVMSKPSKIPIAIRTKLAQRNGIRPVIELDMPVIYTPPKNKRKRRGMRGHRAAKNPHSGHPAHGEGHRPHNGAPQPHGGGKRNNPKNEPKRGGKGAKSPKNGKSRPPGNRKGGGTNSNTPLAAGEKKKPRMRWKKNPNPFSKHIKRSPDLFWPGEKKKKRKKKKKFNKKVRAAHNHWKSIKNNLTINPSVFADKKNPNAPEILPDGTIIPKQIGSNMNITMRRLCENLRLDVILNLRAIHRSQFSNLPKEIKKNSYKCLKWNFVKLYHAHKNSTTKNLKLLKKYCKTQVHLILNRRGVKGLTDYVAHLCGKKLIHNPKLFKMVRGFAQVKEGEEEKGFDILDRFLALESQQYMKGMDDGQQVKVSAFNNEGTE